MTENDPHIDIEGEIRRVTYSSEETGYTVARMKVKGNPSPVTIVGNILAPSPGETLKVSGSWTTHPKFGKQFKVESYSLKNPVTIQGIKNYLGSGLIKGIGSVMASRIVEKFGKKSLDIIEQIPDALCEVEGIGPKRVDTIKNAWKEQRDVRDLMLFLQSHGIGPGPAVKIFRRYGHNAISILTRNPYKLASDIFGIGFLTADNIAEKLGFKKSAPVRVEAGVLFVLNQLTEDGHVYFPYDQLAYKCMDTLKNPLEDITDAFEKLRQRNEIIIGDDQPGPGKIDKRNQPVYLKRYYESEVSIASHLTRIMNADSPFPEINFEKALNWVQDRIKIRFAPGQKEAVKTAASSKLMIITGGPGTGKTTVINAIIKIYKELGAKIQISAPTGRAAKRMSEAASYPAKTIHRALEYTPALGTFQKNQDKPFEENVLIVDEVSMIDTILMSHFLNAVPDNAVLIMVGDINQLPSVGAGNVLKDIINSQRTPCIELDEIFRQSEESEIIVNAHNINNGYMPEINNDRQSSDFFFIEQDDPERVSDIIVELACRRIPDRFGFDPFHDIQVLSPMHKGIVGTSNLNMNLQETLNPGEAKLIKGERSFRINDKVMQLKNNYDKDVYNGDIGKITDINPETQKVTISCDHRIVDYEYSEMDELTLAYAISVHKAQGSEYPAVIIPILTQHYILLQRNLIYTAVTRGKKLVVIIGSKKALSMGIKNDRITERYTNLSSRLKNLEP
ncbi:ATP-dependent RecD-like DNA helicase [Thermodesulfobacteriota bacterium]